MFRTSVWIVPTIAFAIAMPCLAADDISEDFSESTINSLLQNPGGYVFGPNADPVDTAQYTNTSGDREYVSTVATDYNTVDFVFDLTIELNPLGSTIPDGSNLAFMGIGSAQPDPLFYTEPDTAAYLRTWPDSGVEVDTSPSSDDHNEDFFGPLGSTGTILAQIEKTGDTITFGYETNYVSGAYTPSYSTSLSLSQDLPFLNSTNSRLFFGTDLPPRVASMQVLVSTPTSQQPGSNLTNPPPTPSSLGFLKVYDPKTGQFDEAASTSSSNPGYINPNEPTIVMTHGWQSNTSAWAAGMANLIYSAIQTKSGGAGTPVNLVAWDWSSLADTAYNAYGLGAATDVVPNEGIALGAQLADYLGTNYSLPMHYLGHSLGALVDAGAINQFYSMDHSETAVQDTMFDAAEAANPAGIASELLIQAPPTWAPAIPTAPVASIENYVSAFGYLYPKAINVVLTQGPTALNPVAFHGYPMQWYDTTIGSQADEALMGFRYDITQPNGLSGEPIAGTDPFNFVQTAANSGLQLQAITASPPYSTPFETANAEYGDPVQRFTAATFVSGTTALGALLIQNITGDIENTANAVVSTFTIPPDSIDNSSTPEFSTQVLITKQIGATSDMTPSARASSPSMTSVANTAAPTSSGYAWIPTAIPPDAVSISFDFAFNNVSPGDFLSVGINDDLIFEAEDQFFENGVVYNSGSLDISQWTGQDVTLFFGLNAADDNNAGGTITINDIEFQSIPEPSSVILSILSYLLLLRRTSRNGA